MDWLTHAAGMDDPQKSLQRVEAWFSQEMIDRPPIRFHAHNADYATTESDDRWDSQKQRWFDAEYQIESHLKSLADRRHRAETFPLFWPNLGPEVYSAFHGAELQFESVTSYSRPMVNTWDDLDSIRLDWDNPYLKKIDEMTDLAIQMCEGRCFVGYTDLHPGLDCVAAWRDPQQLCLDLLESPEQVDAMLALADAHFMEVFDHFDRKLKAAGHMSMTWMQIPSRGKMHIPSCDFAALISPLHFERVGLPSIRREIEPMTHNVFHMDGPGVAKNLETICDIQDIQAVQWVQPPGDGQAIMQWIPLIRRIRERGKSVVVDLRPEELDDFISAIAPEGIYLCVPVREDQQDAVIDRVLRW